MKRALARLLRNLADRLDPPPVKVPERLNGVVTKPVDVSPFRVRQPISGEMFTATPIRPGSAGSCSKCGLQVRFARFDPNVLIDEVTLSPNCPAGGWHGPVVEE